MGSLIVMLGQNEMNGDHQQMKPVVKTVRRMIVHRDYNPETFDNDIALLELETPFELKPHVVPICLPEQDYHLIGEFAHIAGFGKLNYGKQGISCIFPFSAPSVEHTLVGTGHTKTPLGVIGQNELVVVVYLYKSPTSVHLPSPDVVDG